MKRQVVEGYTILQNQIAELELLLLQIEYDMPSNVQTLSFTPVCHTGESKTESIALGMIEKTEKATQCLNIKKKELELIDTWIKIHKESDREVLEKRIKENMSMKSIAYEMNKTESWTKNKYYKMFK